MPDSQPQPQPQPQLVDLRRSDEFSSLYANTVRVESSVWDLKVLFGELDQSTGKEIVELHTGISMPWPTVKILVHLLLVNIAAHELETGKTRIPPRVLPPPIQLTEEQENNEMLRAVRDLANKMREDFVSKES